LPVDEGQAGDQVLPARNQVAFQHNSADARIPGFDLLCD
jgi:hypothetical protein